MGNVSIAKTMICLARYGDSSATGVPVCCEAATKNITYFTVSVLLFLNICSNILYEKSF